MIAPHTEHARAKVNLALHVLGRRADGFHELDSIVAFADVADILTFVPAAEFTLEAAGPFAAHLPAGEDNIAVKAARAFAAAFRRHQPCRIRLEKHLPVASGIGGGSADAAAVLRGLARLAGIDDDLHDLAMTLGADVPVCLAGRASRMRGAGEHLEPIAGFPKMPALLVNPGLGLATAAVFRELALAKGFPPLTDPVDLAACRNDLTGPAMRLVPAIGEVIATLEGAGATLARMSGSGATCFGVFDTPAAAQTAANIIASGHPGWWVRGVTMG